MKVEALHGDCREVELPANSFHAIIGDPPYGDGTAVRYATGKMPNDYSETNSKATGAFHRMSKRFVSKAWDTDPLVFDPETWSILKQCLMPGGHVVMFAKPSRSWEVSHALSQAGFEIRDVGSWLYSTGMPKSKGLKPCQEHIIFARKPCDHSAEMNEMLYGVGSFKVSVEEMLEEKYPTNLMHDGSPTVGLYMPSDKMTHFWHPKVSKKERGHTLHPTMKPIAVMEHLIKLVTNPGQNVLDPFAGSGTTGLALRNTGRNGTLIERDEDHFKDLQARLLEV